MPVLDWIGKNLVIEHHNKIPFKFLKCDDSKSINPTQNMLIHGDNLEALKSLIPYYKGKIKCVYIDPPYNTGNENWVYNDNMNSQQIKQWLGQVVGIQDLTRHDKWLCMMYPRLKLLKELLSDDGVIFISIDENEIQNLKLMMNEIFKEDCFLSVIANINNPKGRSDAKSFAIAHEYLIVYGKKNAQIGGWKPEENILRRYNKTDSENQLYREIDLRKTGDNDRRIDRPNLFYPFYFNEKTGELYPSKNTTIPHGFIQIYPTRKDGVDGRWRWELNTAKTKLNMLNAKFMPQRKKWSIIERDYFDPNEKIKPTSAWTFKDVNSERGTESFLDLGFDKELFSKPKPVGLLHRIIEIATDPHSNDIILDSFAGSGTTAHATLDLNKEDGGNRKFILVEMEKNIINKITSKRLKKVSEIHGEKDIFNQYELGNTLFDKDGLIDKNCTFKQLASHIFFTETQMPIDKINIKTGLIGKSEKSEIYLLHKKILDSNILKTISSKSTKKIIYADKCTLSHNTLKKYNVIFKQIPYMLKIT